ncbi:hypothetical protein IE980_15770 [Klebsiella pneumoniae]|uniref:Uncharacterized protein n=1 Tax=Klebsiella pneumoniae TaxID=573 RepID=A0A927HYP6_KLEPN|nr:hypothetical protein [Klebsiella pneumoniae]
MSVDKGVLQCVCTVGRFFAHGGADMGDKFSISRRRLLQAGPRWAARCCCRA